MEDGYSMCEYRMHGPGRRYQPGLLRTRYSSWKFATSRNYCTAGIALSSAASVSSKGAVCRERDGVLGMA